MRLIFTACSGRTGTAYLASLLTLSKGVDVIHESPPALPMCRATLDRCPDSWKVKARGTLAYLHDNFHGPLVFVSHAFLKGRPAWWLENHPDTDLIILTRPAREIALSAWKRFSIPGRTGLGHSVKISPEVKANCLVKLRHPGDHTDYGLCYWHALEMEARQAEAKILFLAAGRKVVEISMKQLTTRAPKSLAYFNLLLDLGLEQPDLERYSIIAKCKINGTSSNSTMARALPPNIHNFEEKVREDIV